MSSRNTQYQQFQPPPPIRTATAGSEKSHSSMTSAEALSPRSPFSPGMNSPTTPAGESFFGAITSRMRGRSRSRSRAEASRKRSKSPMVMPPERLPSTTTKTQIASPTTPTTRRPQQSRHVSTSSQTSFSSTTSSQNRPSMTGASRRSTGSSDMWQGRHSNSWLFNDFSVTEQARDIFHRRRK
ncbi:unnamed protein product [Periconia digitata]|uniref:Uncharacterized protein n=1 Tax=Periconia digitata TaxID=1303443 RepID=A0A9W4UUT6_9PLEO|nr:unnamed protein product [Periconia digitata]